MSERQNLSMTEVAAALHGAVSLDVTEQGVQPWRLTFDRINLFEPGVRAKGGAPAGVRLSFVSNTDTLEIHADSPQIAGQYDSTTWTFDLLVDGEFHQRVCHPLDIGNFRFDGIPQGEHRLEVYLEHAVPVRLKSVSIDAGAKYRRYIDTRPRWTVYGSSITQARSSAGPSETWPAIVANRYGLNLTCLGYGGNCHMEPMVARVIRDLPADYISFCLGINVMGASSLSERTFRAAVIGVIEVVRERHPTTPIIVVSPISSPPRETAPNKVGLTLQRVRSLVQEGVDAVREYGDENIQYQDGLELFGPDLANHMPDLLHPDADGYKVLAERYSQIVMPRFGLQPVRGRQS